METTDTQKSYGAKPLSEVVSYLSKSRRIATLIKKHIEQPHTTKALEMVKHGQLVGDLGNIVHDLIEDEIQNNASVAWKCLAGCQEDDRNSGYQINVMKYGKLFHVWAPEFDRVGHFISKEDAIKYILSTWDGIG